MAVVRLERKTVQRLVPGDVLLSGAKILSTPRSSMYGPAGTLEVIVQIEGHPEPTVRYWPRMRLVRVKVRV